MNRIQKRNTLRVLSVLAAGVVVQGMRFHLFDSPKTLSGNEIMVNVVRENSGQVNRYTGRNVIVAIPDFGDVHFPVGTDIRVANAACRELYAEGQQYKQRQQTPPGF